MTLLRESARAKVNLTLRVHGRRDDGYHDIESLVVFADCADTLTLEVGRDLKLVTVGPGASDCGDGADNLVLRVARALGEKVDGMIGGTFTLDKHLPVAAGIGGGSADAAAALRLLATANGIALDDPRIAEVARATGADIPVCVLSRPCTMTGVGENLSFLKIPALPSVMINPRVAVATKDVFGALGLAKGETHGDASKASKGEWPASDADVDAWLKVISAQTNDLEPPALQVEPIIGDVLAALRGTSGIRLARMSGSGATCFGIFSDDASARAAAIAISKARPNWWVHAGTLS